MEAVTANNITFNCAIGGVPTAPALVFINSLGTDLRIWDGVVPHFATGYRLVQYDKRGHGLSDCPPAPYSMDDHAHDLAGLLDALAIEQAVLVGVSVGGMIAQTFAAAWPERVRGLVLCDTAAVIGTAVFWNTRINYLRQHGLNHETTAPILERWFASAFAQTSPAAHRIYANMLARMPLEGYVGTCAAIRDADLSQRSRTIQAPTLVVCGAEDSATPPNLTHTLLDLIPLASYREIPGAGHLPCVEQPELLAKVIGEFLRGLRK